MFIYRQYRVVTTLYTPDWQIIPDGVEIDKELYDKLGVMQCRVEVRDIEMEDEQRSQLLTINPKAHIIDQKSKTAKTEDGSNTPTK
jgi:hypothetical protein